MIALEQNINKLYPNSVSELVLTCGGGVEPSNSKLFANLTSVSQADKILKLVQDDIKAFSSLHRERPVSRVRSVLPKIVNLWAKHVDTFNANSSRQRVECSTLCVASILGEKAYSNKDNNCPYVSKNTLGQTFKESVNIEYKELLA